jgi:serine O-acetyltransferase
MIQTLTNNDLIEYLSRQLKNSFPDNIPIENLADIIDKALEKIKYCFNHISLPYYSKDNKPFFNHLNADHYTVFIYYCSNLAFKNNDIDLAGKLFYLNKTLHSFHCMYDTDLPDIFIICHGVGTVLGKARYSNYFVTTQGCTVGANAKLEYPDLGEYIIMYPNSSILGNSKISHNVIFGNNSLLLNQNIDHSSLVVQQHPNVIIKPLNNNIFSQFFKSEIHE